MHSFARRFQIRNCFAFLGLWKPPCHYQKLIHMRRNNPQPRPVGTNLHCAGHTKMHLHRKNCIPPRRTPKNCISTASDTTKVSRQRRTQKNGIYTPRVGHNKCISTVSDTKNIHCVGHNSSMLHPSSMGTGLPLFVEHTF